MYVCLCKGVTDAQVRAAAAAGAREVADLSRACEAGAGCGGCHRLLARLLSGWPPMVYPEEDRTPAARLGGGGCTLGPMLSTVSEEDEV